jgi:hypothetical protein
MYINISGQEFGHHRICNRCGISPKPFGLQLRSLEYEKLDVTSAYVLLRFTRVL